MVRPQGDICSLCCTTLMLLFFQYSVNIACTQRKTTTTVTLPCAYLLNLGACEVIFCLFQITICLAVYCNFFNFNKTFRKMHKHLEYQISCRCQQFFFLKNAPQILQAPQIGVGAFIATTSVDRVLC